jgi:hypothetical protein
MKRILLPLMLLLAVSGIWAQTGDWDTYLARYEKGPGSTMVNMGLKATVPDSTHPFLFAAGVKFRNCTNEGLPAPTSFISLTRISDSVVALMGRLSSSILTGTFSYQCERKDYFYVTDTTGLKQAVTNMLRTVFPDYTPAFLIKEDKKWDAYLHFLYPNDETREYMANQKIIMRLQKAGDKPEIPRTIDHFLLFKSSADRDCFIYKAISQHFKIVSTENGLTPSDFKLHISRTDNLDLAAVNKLTLWLKNEAKKCKGNYDGWETAITRKL